MSASERSARVHRQSAANRMAHWLVALSIFALFVTGMGQMPMYQRYGVAALPGMAWSADFRITLWWHYLAGALLMGAVAFHVTYAFATRRFTIVPRRGDLRESAQIIAAMFTGGEEPPSHKYLAEQRVAYAFIGVTTLALIASGVIKALKNLPGFPVPPEVVWFSTLAHNVSAMLLLIGIVGHLAAFAIKANRALLPAMFDGTVDRAYAQHRHPLWYDEIASTRDRAA